MRRAMILPLVLSLLLLGACSSDPSDPPPAETGTIRVHLVPQSVGATWTLRDPAGEVTGFSGDQELTDMAAGTYRVDFLPLAGYQRPDAVTVELAANATEIITGTYVADVGTTGSVAITVTPAGLGLRWVLKVEADGGIHDVMGIGNQIVEDLPPGAYTVDWQPYPDWTEPDGGQTDGMLVAGAMDQVAGAYVPRGKVAMTMVRVPAGLFTMGSQDWELGFAPPFFEPIRPDNEAPRHEVTLTRDLLASVYEVTQDQYETIHGTNPSQFGPGSNLPVETVNWLQAVQFCNELSADAGLTLAYTITGPSVIWNQDADGYRLPTEAEWEYLARAGRDEAFNFGPITEPFFSDPLDPVLDRVGWYLRNSGGSPEVVGAKLPNAWGLHDVHGNVWEWCWDRYGADYYTEDPETDPTGPTLPDQRVIRGGSYSDPAANCRSAVRLGESPDLPRSYIGFRVVRWAPDVEKAGGE